ncbi:ABC transporter permease [Bordetella genomosp. 12]|uniref:Transport permease protein n=1 Tax=Bordetella genomosp. 12 TaxID=463035 RepID=A0A261VDV5_9BORD|nr:ABC transporter permease [Bordetella genomosp. 12]OZI72185.1 ABC transporter [Bordetella genomosp. 12]
MFDRSRLLWKHRHLLWATTLTDVRIRSSGTILGIVWTLLYPLMFLGLYAVVYTMIFKIRLGGFSTFEYVLLIFSGLIPFLGFSESLGSGVSCVLGNKGLVKNTLFPIELIPVKTVLASSVTMLVGLSLLLIVLWANGIVHPTQLLLPIIILLQLIFTVGLIWLLSAINVFVPDIAQTVSIMTLFLMLVSPIAYTHSMIPAAVLPFMYLNPLYYLIMLYRDAVFLGDFPLSMLLTFTLIACGFFTLGGYVFSRLKPLFADYV